jgi:folate-dependent phosphoribosylglycinamide formyltransferase PurN
MFGRHVHAAVIAAGETQSGCTVHWVNNAYDAGPVILRRTCPVLPGDTPETLAARVFEEEKIAYVQAIERFIRDRE